MSRARIGSIGRALGAIAGLAFLGFFAAGGESAFNGPLLFKLTLAGVATGGVFALSGMGLVLTYKATGVFNFAHGAVAMFVAYMLWQMASPQRWGWPLWIAAPLAILVVGPLLGVLLERAVFRPLAARGAGVAEQLVATLGVFVLLVGIAFALWTSETRDAIELFSGERITCDADGALGWLSVNDRGVCGITSEYTLTLGVDQMANVAIAMVLSLGLWLLFRFTFLGTRIRAVVDRRQLAEMSSVNANRVAAISWAIGCGLAGLTGILLAPTTFGLDPFRLTLLVIETFAVAIIARLVSLPLAIAGGLFLGVATSFATIFSFADLATAVGASGDVAARVSGALDPILTSLAVFVLFGALMTNRRLDIVGDEGAGLVARSTVGGDRRGRYGRPVNVVIALVLVALPFGLTFGSFRYAHQMIALAIVFASIVAVTGFSGHITLGQAGFAGFGAFMTGRIHAGELWGVPELPIIPAMLLAAVLCIPIGFIAGYPALKRRGLFLGLTTLALGLVLQRYVFDNVYFNNRTKVRIERPELFGLSLKSDLAFYFFELVVLVLAFALVRNLRSGRLGRILAAMRDSETASVSVGINLRRYKLFIFSASAFIAGLGGSLLAQSAKTFGSETYNPFTSLLWFAAVVVAGVTSIHGALLAAFLLTMLDLAGGEGSSGLSEGVVGLAALALGRLPGGLVGLVRRVTVGGWVPRGLQAAYRDAADPPPPRPALTPTPLALEAIAIARGSNGHIPTRTGAAP